MRSARRPRPTTTIGMQTRCTCGCTLAVLRRAPNARARVAAHTRASTWSLLSDVATWRVGGARFSGVDASRGSCIFPRILLLGFTGRPRQWQQYYTYSTVQHTYLRCASHLYVLFVTPNSRSSLQNCVAAFTSTFCVWCIRYYHSQ